MALAPTSRARLQAMLACVGIAFVCWHTRAPLAYVAAALVAFGAALAWLTPRRYAPVQHALDRLTQALLAGLTWVLLGFVYFGLFTPLRALGGLLRRDPLEESVTANDDSFLRPLLPVHPERFRRQF